MIAHITSQSDLENFDSSLDQSMVCHRLMSQEICEEDIKDESHLIYEYTEEDSKVLEDKAKLEAANYEGVADTTVKEEVNPDKGFDGRLDSSREHVLAPCPTPAQGKPARPYLVWVYGKPVPAPRAGLPPPSTPVPLLKSKDNFGNHLLISLNQRL